MLDSMGCNPFEGMARIANDDDVATDLRLQAYKELAQYCLPKKRAIEHTGSAGGPIEINVNPVESLASRIAQLRIGRGDQGNSSEPARK